MMAVMKMTPEDFLNWPKKALTVIGMSGLGKTHISCILARQGWTHYSCDEIIGTEFLAAELGGAVTKKNLAPLSAFIGKVGDPAKGGLLLDEFRRRQNLYYQAECESLRRVGNEIAWAKGHFINDSTGSLCEIEDAALLDELGRQTLFVYIKASAEEEERILARAVSTPKPLFFPPAMFDGWLADFMRRNNAKTVAEIDPDEFSRWVFPLLFKSRLPKYQALADRYGVTVPSEAMAEVKTERDFIACIAEALRA